MEQHQQNGKDGLWITDDDAHTVFVNNRMAEILGTSQSEMTRQNSFDYIYPEDLESAQRLFRQKTDGSRAPFQFRLRRNDGTAVWVQVQATPMFNAEGRFTGIVGTFTAVARGEE